MEDEILSDINVTPFVDVMLVLLIIFMIVTPLITSSVGVELPAVSTTETKKEDNRAIIHIDENSKLYLDKQELDDSLLATALESSVSKDSIIYFYVDRSVSYERLMEVVEILKELDYSKIALATAIKKE